MADSVSIRQKGETQFWNDLNQASEADVNALPTGRPAAHFRKFSLAHGGSASLTLLTRQKGNNKTAKNAKSPNPLARQSNQATLALSPANKSGVTNTCGTCSSKGCYNNCLNDSNNMSGDAQQRAQLIKTKYGVEHPDHFLALLRDELGQHAEESWADELHPVARLNTTSDTAYERLKSSAAIYPRFIEHPSGIHIPEPLQHLPGMTFSEYTGENMRGPLGRPETPEVYPNISKVHSAKEHTHLERIKELLDQGRNVTVPLNKKANEPVHPVLRLEDVSNGPSRGKHMDAPAINGDRDDARWADPEQGVLIGLTEKRPGHFAGPNKNGRDSQGNKIVINSHENDEGFIREHVAGDPSVTTPMFNLPTGYNARHAAKPNWSIPGIEKVDQTPTGPSSAVIRKVSGQQFRIAE